MSPVEMWGTPSSSERSFACVPFPAPGGPRRMRIMRGSGRARPAVRGGRDGSCVDGPPGGELAAADARATRAGEPLVVPGDEVPLDLLDRVERDAHHDEERGAAEVELHLEP